jgi:hypothetical protein
MKLATCAAAAAAVSLAAATAADAATMSVDIDGVIFAAGWVNTLDAFQTGGGSSLDGLPIHMQFLFNPDAAWQVRSAQPGHITILGAGPNLLQASATVNGITLRLDQAAPIVGGRVEYYNNELAGDPDLDEVQYSASSYDAATQDYREMGFRYYSYVTEILTQDSFNETFDQTPPLSFLATDGFFDFERNSQATAFQFAANHVVVAPYSATPEPAAWATMILGLGAAGALLRRRALAA